MQSSKVSSGSQMVTAKEGPGAGGPFSHEIRFFKTDPDAEDVHDTAALVNAGDSKRWAGGRRILFS